MEQEIKNKLEEQDKKLNAIFSSVEKMRKYFRVILWITVAVVVLPAIGLVFVIPQFVNTYTTSLQGLL